MHHLALTPNPYSVGAARRFVDECLDGAPRDVRDTVVLLASELVTNAVIHGGPHGPTATIVVGVEAAAEGVRVEVSDTGRGVPMVGDGSPDRRGGRGLVLVQALASRWGWDIADPGKSVWFEVDAPPDESGDAACSR